MYEILKAIAAANGWGFYYGRQDFSNLVNEDSGTNHIFLDPVIIDDIVNDMGIIEQRRYTGGFMIMASSDIDEIDYDARYQNYIKPILAGAQKTIKSAIRCIVGVEFVGWQMIEVINIFDNNYDGYLIKYNIVIDGEDVAEI